MKIFLTNYNFTTFATTLGLLGLLFLTRFENYFLAALILAYQLFIPLLVSKNNILILNFKMLSKIKSDLILLFLFILILFPIFILGFILFFNFNLYSSLKNLSLPNNFVILLITQVFLVAFPEEFFYRGFLQSRFKNIHLKFIITNIFFALAHFVSGFNPLRLLTFFPGLAFSYLAFKTNNLLASILFHASCNILGQILVLSFF